MAKNKGLTCDKHWLSTLVDQTMIIHQFGGALCDSETFNDVTHTYDRKGVKTGTPIDFKELQTIKNLSIGPIHI